MNLSEIINDKLGRKEIMCLTGMYLLQSQPYLCVAIGLVGIISQALADWKSPRINGNGTSTKGTP